MKNILVTGGAGFIGSHTVVELANSNYNPIIVDDFSNSNESVIERLNDIVQKKVIYYKGKYQDTNLLAKINAKYTIEGIIHFAAFKAVGESTEQPLIYYENNVAGLVTLLKFLELNKISTFVFSSSCTVYGEPDKLPITEESSIKVAASPYGSTKQMCETIISDVSKSSKNLRSISLRYFNPIGAHESAKIGELPIGVPANLVPFVTQAAAGLRKELIVYGNDYPTPDGTCIRDYIHVVDLAKAHIRALEYLLDKPASFNDFVNIGTGKGSSVLDVINTFERATGQKVPYRFGPRRSGDIVKIYAGIKKAKIKLNWTAEKSLEDSLKDAWRWQETLVSNNL
jgi:UDP-glucose 4-epimerase